MSTNEPEPWMISREEFMSWLKATIDELSRVDVSTLTDDELREQLGAVAALMLLVDQQLSQLAESIRERGLTNDDAAQGSEAEDVDDEPDDRPQRSRGKAPP